MQRSFVFPVYWENINGGAVFKKIDGRTGKKYNKIQAEEMMIIARTDLDMRERKTMPTVGGYPSTVGIR